VIKACSPAREKILEKSDGAELMVEN